MAFYLAVRDIPPPGSMRFLQDDDLRMQQDMLQQLMQQLDAQSAIEQRQSNDLSASLLRLQSLGTKGYVSTLDIQQQRTQELDAEQQIKALAGNIPRANNSGTVSATN